MTTNNFELRTVNELRSLLFESVKTNFDTQLYSFYIEPRERVALAGHRKLYGTGDSLVRVQYRRFLEDEPRLPSLYDYFTEEAVEANGLPGREIPESNGRRELYTAQKAEEKFNEAFHMLKDYFILQLNPRKILDFIENRTKTKGFENRKFNLQAFSGVSSNGTFPGQVEFLEDGTPTIAIRTRDKVIPAFIDERNSLVNINKIQQGEFYIVQRTSIVDGRREVRLLREFQRGVRMSIQEFRSGVLLPNQPRYSVYEEVDNGITMYDILDVPFLEGQQGDFTKAPDMHFDLSTFYQALKPMEMCDVVTMYFKDSVSPVLLSGETSSDDEPLIDALVGPTPPYVSGKVCTE